MPDHSQLYIGLMSGTSMDGIDAALVDFAKPDDPRLIDCISLPYDAGLQAQLHRLCVQSNNEIELMGCADQAVAQAFSDTITQLLQRNQLDHSDIVAVGSHGQTIRHAPNALLPFTLQIGDPHTLAALSGIEVIADFRRKDMARGGQGAPLVPAFHASVFCDTQQNRAVVNIGGIANITYLPSGAERQAQILGFDTGPGNRLMDAWITRHLGKPFDENGQWAKTGSVDSDLLAQLMRHDYLHQPFPKSTGREVFHLDWLDAQLREVQNLTQNAATAPENVQRTLLEFTVQSIALHLQQLGRTQTHNTTYSGIEAVYVCGGGALNGLLMQRLSEIGQQQKVSPYRVSSTQVLGVDPNVVEAMAFAWLAYAFKQRIPGNVPSVTGARRPAILGAWFPSQ